MIKKTLLTLTTLLLLGCNAQTSAERYFSRPHKVVYVDFEKWKEGRLCSELRFQCLPESQDKAITETPLENGLDSFELTPEAQEKFQKIVKQWQKDYDEYHSKAHPKGEKEPMLISDLDKKFFDKVKKKRFLKKMEASLEKEFPGFWRDIPKAVRYRWIQHAMYKAKKLGYTESMPNGIIELCARIGLNFDNDPKYREIKEFITLPHARTRAYDIIACRYIDFTIFNKDIDMAGRPITDWSLRQAIPPLPQPKRLVPKLND